MADLNQEILQTLRDIQRGLGSGRGAGATGTSSSSGGGSGKTLTDAEKAAERLTASLDEARTSFLNLQRSSKDYGAVSKLNNVAHSLFGKTTMEADAHMESLNTAIADQKDVWINAKKAGDTKAASEAKSNLTALQNQRTHNEQLSKSASAVGGSVSGLISTFAGLQNRLIGIEAAYQANMMQMISQGASGFSLFGAAVEANIEKITAAADAQADAAKTAANALGQMGGVVLPIVGMMLNLMADRAKAVAHANEQLAKQGIRILVEEGNKLIKTHMAMTGAGLVFANGMQGMVNATNGTKLRLEEMTKVVVDHKEALVSSGLGIGEATNRVGAVAKMFAGTTGKFANMDRQLLALGYSYEEQAGMAAETLGEMRRGAGGQNVTNTQVAQATADYAKNLSLLKSLSDEDVKGKMDQRKKENMELAFELQMAKMSPAQRAELKSAMAKMTDLEARNLRERMVYGTVINKAGAVMEAQSSGVKSAGEDYYRQLKNNSLTVKSVADTQARYGPQIAKDIERSGKAIGAAAMSGKGDVGDAAKGMADMYRTSQKTTAQAVKEGQEAIDNQMDTAAKPTTKGDPTAALLDAIEIGAKAAKNMQEKVVNVIGEIAEQLKKHYDGLDKAFANRNFTGDGAGADTQSLMNMAILAMIALPIIRGLLQGGWMAAMNKVRTGSWLGKVTPPEPTPTTTTATPSGGPGGRKGMTPEEMKKYTANREAGMSSAEAKRQAQGFKSMNRTAEAMAERTKSVADGLAQTGPRATTALNTASKEVGVLGKSMNFIKGGFEKVGKKLPILGTVLAVGTAGFQIFNTESRLAAGEISKEDARTEEGGIVGGAAGAAAGGWGGAALGAAIGTMILPGVGTAIGGLLGGAIGAWGGEELGSKLGESLMSHWGDISDWTSKMGKSVVDSTSAAWTTAKNWLATDGKQYWNMFTSGAKQIGGMALGLLEQIPVIGPMVKGVEKALSSAKEHFLSAGKSISGFLSDSAAKFKQTFPELTAGVASVVEFMTAGLGKLVDVISTKAGEAWGWVKEKTGFGDKSTQTPNAPNATTASPANSTSSAAAKNTSAEKPATGPGTVNLEGEYKKNADSWVAAVQSGKSFDSVPDMYKPYVKAQLAKGTPKSKPVTTATPTSPPGNAPTASTPSSSTPPPKVETAATPQKKELTAQEKAAVYETIATNTKYTADLMQSQIRAINSMAQQLAAITEATRDTATAAKKTAQRVN